MERLDREIRRRTDVVGNFPDRASVTRLVGAVLAEQHEEWAEGRRYLGLDVLTRSQALDAAIDEGVSEPALQALTEHPRTRDHPPYTTPKDLTLESQGWSSAHRTGDP